MHPLAFLSSRKRFVVTGLGVFLLLLIFFFFPLNDRINSIIQNIILGVAFLALVPILFTKYVLRESIASLGFCQSSRKFGWISIPLLLIPAFSMMILIVKATPFAEQYSLPVAVSTSFPFFLAYEIFLVGSLAFLYEVFFRGFVQLLWLREYGWWSVVFQAAVFIGFMFLIEGGGLSWQEVPVFIAAFFSGFVAFYTKSIWYSWILSWLLFFLFDAYFLAFH